MVVDSSDIKMKIFCIFFVIILCLLLNLELSDGKPLLFRLIKNIFRKGNKKPFSYKPPPKSPTSGYNRPPPLAIPIVSHLVICMVLKTILICCNLLSSCEYSYSQKICRYTNRMMPFLMHQD